MGGYHTLFNFKISAGGDDVSTYEIYVICIFRLAIAEEKKILQVEGIGFCLHLCGLICLQLYNDFCHMEIQVKQHHISSLL